MITKIDETKCTGCGKCFFLCPLDVFRLNTFREEMPPCQAACPAGVDIRSCLYRMQLGRIDDAIKLLREALPIPAVTGRVCFHPCETECSRRRVENAVGINAIERFVADYWLQEKAETLPRQHVGRVAVVGSGPAGLAAAYDLVRQGYPVTVFESMAEPGGMLRAGIPEYRLPREVLDCQINYIRDMGVEFRTGVTVGKDITICELKDSGYKAVFIAVGAQASLKLNIPGEELKGVHYALDFLRDVNTGKKVAVKGRVVVVGGGNAAIDSARVARRFGAAEVLVVYRRTRQDMLAYPGEVAAAEDEGVKFSYLTATAKILGRNGKVSGIECLKTKLGRKDADGRRSPMPVVGSEFVIDADMVIAAIGEAPDLTLWTDRDGYSLTHEGTLKVEAVSLVTSIKGVFTGGDAVTGPSSVVEAIASGKKAAVSIDLYLRGQDINAVGNKVVKKVKKLPGEGMEVKVRQVAPLAPVDGRSHDFREVRLGFNGEMALLEAERCLTCGSKAYIAYPDDCMTCYLCELKCPYEAMYVHPFKEELPLALEYQERR